MEYPTVLRKVTELSVKLYTPFLKDACAFDIPFWSSGVLTGLHAKEKCTCNQLDDGCVQMGVCFIVDVED